MINRRRLLQLGGSVALGSALPLGAMQAEACTRVLWNNPGRQVLVGRTMDWPESTEPKLYALPAGLARDGGKLGPHVVVPQNPLRWRARYGSLIAAAYDLGAVDGVNARGLAGHLLYLTETDFGARDVTRPGLQAGLWLQYALDCAATVAEALALLAPVQPVMIEAEGHKASVHLAIEDATGDSAIIEYIGGQAVIHHSPEDRVMTNDPPYAQQLVLLKQMQSDPAFIHPSRNTPLPGNVNPVDRFQRASFFSQFLPEPKTERDATAAMFSIMANVSVPIGAPYKDFGTYNTEYRSVINLSTRTYYFQLTTVPSVSWTRLDGLDLKAGAPALTLDPDGVDIGGDVVRRYRPVTPPF
ncbi:linear amide C-N hydrolase [Acidisoma silvae]|uniref:Linear amide C-N hydrolase n=1 Tax=Acidisoma silvae TaxID=2802396 RepID=A0A964DY11_9PROT|nr:linear amide C-N hydrolase [Acidisoma silvae]MCB8874278.1 linear amide C-N hydrolase [Acidisoma silvae]